MCGIVGVVRAGGVEPADRDRVATAVEALRHRGPDGNGVHAEPRCVLGHTRLSIVDLAGGGQPMRNEDGSVLAVFNGEIWNHLDLRRRLEQHGHRFATRCDTEVLVHGYEEWGDRLPSFLNGMFAFAVWDGRRERVLLARDRLGKKPLYMAELDRGLVFGSDARSVLLAGGRKPEVDCAHLGEFLFQRYVGGSRTLFRGVSRLEPGHLATFEDARKEIRRYWSVDPGPERDVAAEELRALLLDAVSKRLMSDVPLGVLLSGGVDSASVLGLMREAGAGSLSSFTIGFDDPLYDERPLARVAAAGAETEHHELVVGAEDFLAAVPRLAWYRDEPLAETSEVPLLLLAELAGRHVKVVLSGDGGDEVFGGYPKYRAERLLRLGPVAPLALRLAGKALATRPSSRRWRRAVATFSVADPTLRWASWFCTYPPSELDRLLVPALRGQATPEHLVEPLTRLLAPHAGVDPGRRMLLGDLLTYLPDNMLLRADKVLMGASVEGRMPLVDYRIVELASRIPASSRSGLRRGKAVLRDAVRDFVPRQLLDAPKRGFAVPVARFMLADPHRTLERLLLSERAAQRGFFERAEVVELLQGGRLDPLERELRIFTLASLELWLRANVDDLRIHPPAEMTELLDEEDEPGRPLQPRVAPVRSVRAT
jgi:asparagine synthase (glutamine-hydrolysing)